MSLFLIKTPASLEPCLRTPASPFRLSNHVSPSGHCELGHTLPSVFRCENRVPEPVATCGPFPPGACVGAVACADAHAMHSSCHPQVTPPTRSVVRPPSAARGTGLADVELTVHTCSGCGQSRCRPGGRAFQECGG